MHFDQKPDYQTSSLGTTIKHGKYVSGSHGWLPVHMTRNINGEYSTTLFLKNVKPDVLVINGGEGTSSCANWQNRWVGKKNMKIHSHFLEANKKTMSLGCNQIKRKVPYEQGLHRKNGQRNCYLENFFVLLKLHENGNPNNRKANWWKWITK